MQKRDLVRLAVFGAVALCLWAVGRAREPRTPPRSSDLHGPTALALAEPCARCHEKEVAAFRGSQHASAMHAFEPSKDTASPVAPAVGVIGVAPLRQLVVAAPDGRLQVLDPAWDTAKGEWFSIHGKDTPRPDEWGHWTKPGMNWNAQCAFCHMTGLQKGWDPKAARYSTTWSGVGVGCAQCHGTDEHPKQKAAEVCASCHSRREDLTGDYRPGDPLEQHFAVSFTSELYDRDGHAKDEVFEWGSLQLSRMGVAGVSCVDCHDPHSGRLRVEGDALCLGCHAPPTARGAIPVAADHAKHGSVRCVECHMPQRRYMQRDLRRDHRFSSGSEPCTGCHADMTTEKIDATFPRLKEVRLAEKKGFAWRALLASSADRASLSTLLGDPHPLVRAVAARRLAGVVEVRPRLLALRSDPFRVVRLAAAWATRATPITGPLRMEVLRWLEIGSDQPAGALRMSEWALIEGRRADALLWAERAVAWDPSEPSKAQLARVQEVH